MEREGQTHLLSHSQLSQLERDGFLIVEDFFSPEELLPVLKGSLLGCREGHPLTTGVHVDIEARVDSLAQRLHAAGKIREAHAEADVFRRLALIEQQFKDASGTPAPLWSLASYKNA